MHRAGRNVLSGDRDDLSAELADDVPVRLHAVSADAGLYGLPIDPEPMHDGVHILPRRLYVLPAGGLPVVERGAEDAWA